MLLVIFASTIMLNFKKIKNNTFKISLGLFLSVVIYYINNFFYILGSTERISTIVSVLLPMLILSFFNLIFLKSINEK